MAMRDGYTVVAGPTGPVAVVTTRGGLVRHCTRPTQLAQYVGPAGEHRWPGLLAAWRAAGGHPLPRNPHPPVDEVLAMVASLNERTR
jgi:hypothetical protein